MTRAPLLLLPAMVFAQVFEVTSVKPDKRAVDRSRRSELECSPGGRFVSRGNLLIQSIMFGWNVPGLQVSGMPGWATMAGVRRHAGSWFRRFSQTGSN